MMTSIIDVAYETATGFGAVPDDMINERPETAAAKRARQYFLGLSADDQRIVAAEVRRRGERARSANERSKVAHPLDM